VLFNSIYDDPDACVIIPVFISSIVTAFNLQTQYKIQTLLNSLTPLEPRTPLMMLLVIAEVEGGLSGITVFGVVFCEPDVVAKAVVNLNRSLDVLVAIIIIKIINKYQISAV
jgi:hypothetical protein